MKANLLTFMLISARLLAFASMRLDRKLYPDAQFGQV
jgi:hypothetical protein